MKRLTSCTGAACVLALVALAARDVAGAQDRQAVPRQGQASGQEPSQPRERRPPSDDPQKPQRRPPDDESRRAKPRDDRDRRPSERGQPPRRAAAPRRHYFTPIGVRVRWYYHPYFGFYYGPYYGPYYPGAGVVAPVRFNEGSLRLKVRPVGTEVYVNGYYAGIVDDFDGVFQRLYLPRGEHEITLRLTGYQSHAVPVRVRRGETIDIVHEMHRLAPGRSDLPAPAPRRVPPEWSEPPVSGEQRASPYGILALRTDPSDAQIVIDGEAWAAIAGQSEFVIHLMAGWHRIEVRREGYQQFSTRVELIEGQTIRLDASLVRR
jgi:hypothetical protein